MIVCPWKDLNRYADVIPGLEEAVKFVNSLENFEPATYPLSGRNKVLVQSLTTKPFETSLLEAHRQFLDIQYIIKGKEVVGWAPLETLTLDGEFNTAKDKGMYAGPVDFMTIRQGYCYVAFPEDAHMPNLHLEAPKHLKKLVLKLKV